MSDYGTYEVHPYAHLWPLLPDGELKRLADDIRTYGLREPIWLHPDGRVIDGRNRLRACILAGVEPATREYQGTDAELLPFLVSLNMARRHMDESQRAMVAAKIANLSEGRPSETASIEAVSQSDASKLMNVSRSAVQRAAKVQQQAAPELVEAVQAGLVSVSAASGLIHAPAEEQRRVAEIAKTESYKETQDAIKEARATTDAVRDKFDAFDVPIVTSMPTAHVGYNSGDNEWYTPHEYIEAARAVMGGIDLDPATSRIANSRVKAERFYTERDDGLTQPWDGRVWMNPPYAQPLIDRFSERVARAYADGGVTEACVLVNNATETGWFQTIAAEASAVCFPKGRIKFWHPDKISAPLQGQAVLYLGPNPEAFKREFHTFGFVAVI